VNDNRNPALRVAEGVLTTGLLVSQACLLVGLLAQQSALLRWGLALLMLTPVARVVAVTLALARRREWLFAALSLWILAVTASSIAVLVKSTRLTMAGPIPRTAVECQLPASKGPP
jgi:uncharacterized membrane protein